MNAVVLAGGFGSRLKPLTDHCPKPMLPLAGRPMLDYTVAQLHAYGIRNITFTLSYLPEKIIRFVSGYRTVTSSYYIENTPLGTCGGVKAACGSCGGTFIVLSGDALSDIDLAALYARHYESGADITIAAARTINPSLYGVVEADEAGYVRRFVEKPAAYTGEAWVNCGVYCIRKSVLDQVPDNYFFDFSRDLFPALVHNRKLAVYRHPGYWSDIGDYTSYYNANFDMLSGGFYPFVKNTRVTPLGKAELESYTRGAEIRGGAVRSVIEDSVITERGSVKDCVVLPGARVDGDYERCVIGNGYVIPIEEREQNFSQNVNKFFSKQL